MIDSDDYEVMDMENYRGEKKVVWSHQELVMRAMKEVLKITCHELTDGIVVGESKGKEKMTIKEDLRQAFINSVKMCKAMMNRDFDDEAKKKIPTYLQEVEDKRKELLGDQWKWWNNLNPKQRQSQGLIMQRNFFNRTLPFYTEFIEFQIEKSWNIFEELNNLVGRFGDYEVEDLEG